MAKSSSKDEKTVAKLRKLSKDDLIWCILEMEKHNLGFPSISSILSDLEHKKTIAKNWQSKPMKSGWPTMI